MLQSHLFMHLFIQEIFTGNNDKYNIVCGNTHILGKWINVEVFYHLNE